MKDILINLKQVTESKVSNMDFKFKKRSLLPFLEEKNEGEEKKKTKTTDVSDSLDYYCQAEIDQEELEEKHEELFDSSSNLLISDLHVEERLECNNKLAYDFSVS
jgi:hypothetical protein